MHSAVMQNKKYIEFASKNTVEVICESRLDEGRQKGDPKSGTYKVKGADGQEVEFMLEWPNLTYEEMIRLASSKAATYNKTGGIPYTCLVDPWTENEIVKWSGGQSAKTIIGAAEEARKTLVKEHGNGISRDQIKKIEDAEMESKKLLEANEFSKALDSLAKVGAKTDTWPESMKNRFAEQKQKAIEAATAALETAKALEPAKAKKEVSKLLGKLNGTGLEMAAKEFLKSLSTEDKQ